MDDILKKLSEIESQIKKLRELVAEASNSDVLNFNALDKRIDEKIGNATHEILKAIKEKLNK